mgnify:CR=1 FL=1
MFVVVMGRKAGHLALGIGKAAGGDEAVIEKGGGTRTGAIAERLAVKRHNLAAGGPEILQGTEHVGLSDPGEQ